MNLDPKQLQDLFSTYVVQYSTTLLTTLAYALVVLFVGLWLVRLATRLAMKAISHTIKDPSLSKFLQSLIRTVLLVVLFITVASILGIQTTSFAAILGAASLAIGLSLQGSLANFAGGILILAFKPFKVGDFIEALGFMGVVKEIQIFTTVLTTGDNKNIIIPNGNLSNSPLINYSKEPNRRVDLIIGVSYNADLKKTKEVLYEVLTTNNKVLKEPAPNVFVQSLADSSVNFAVRPWCKSADYWAVYGEVLEAIKLRLDEEGIEIPFPQRVVHLKKDQD
jgi:small conductance mechanosensitive channel